MYLKIPFLKIDWTMVAWTSWTPWTILQRRFADAQKQTALHSSLWQRQVCIWLSQQLFIWKFYIKSNYKNAHTFFLAFRKQKSLKLDLLGVKSGCGFSNSDVTRFQIFSQTMSYEYVMAQYQKKLRDMKLLGFGLFTKTVGKGILARIKYG